MSDIVIDASVAVKWVLPEEDSETAAALLSSRSALHAPAHWLAEAVNAIWARCSMRREITHDELRERTGALLKVPVETTDLPDLLQDATRLSGILRATVYDTLYLALALRRDMVLVTADGRFVNQARAGGEPYRSAVRLLAEWPVA